VTDHPIMALSMWHNSHMLGTGRRVLLISDLNVANTNGIPRNDQLFARYDVISLLFIISTAVTW
jgi:hypothetical protein